MARASPQQSESSGTQSPQAGRMFREHNLQRNGHEQESTGVTAPQFFATTPDTIWKHHYEARLAGLEARVIINERLGPLENHIGRLEARLADIERQQKG